ncbi:MAG TPA: type II toxin-antitoxin system PemK/MazF family toxin [Nocardioidaceae bacterium]|nr:type II toxin-antitoxin system PemK/MazF family toxin [Nocardioidaceae bacterium]
MLPPAGRLLRRLSRRITGRTRRLIEYAPRADGRPDPGEVVWAWVPYEDDPRRGKDRPVLVVGRRGRRLLVLSLTSKDHDRDAADEARYGRYWMDVGSGAWDAQRRPSEVRLDRLLTLHPRQVRREGAALDRARFEAVVAAARSRGTL